MMQTHSQGRGRAAFTMIELLIVVAIIAVLVALMTGGVMRVLALGQRTEVSSDIMKMDQSLKIAMQKYSGIQFLPSKLRLRNNITAYNPADTLDKHSMAVLRMMFGKRLFTTTAPVPTLNWIPSAPAVLELQGAECLVFYLGGVSDGTRLTGFSTDPRNPTASGGERIGPFFEFQPTRLRVMSGRQAPVYIDPYGTPYAYFGPTAKGAYTTFGATSDCLDYDAPRPLNLIPVPPQGLVDGPYRDSSIADLPYLNPSTFQIVSAGPDRVFGRGGKWNATTGTAPDDTTPYYRDNLTNFSQSELGNEQQ